MLCAARELTKAKRSVILLEAASRIGGRALDHQWPSGAVTELGVEFLGHRSDAPATYKLFVDELKLSIYSHGAFVANASQQFVCRNMGGNVSSVGGKFLPGELLKCGSPAAAAEGVAALAELDLLIAQMDASRPWAHPKAAELDATTWEAWMAKRLGPEALIYVNRGLAPSLALKVSQSTSRHRAASSSVRCSSVGSTPLFPNKKHTRVDVPRCHCIHVLRMPSRRSTHRRRRDDGSRTSDRPHSRPRRRRRC